ncbi:resolvase, partial [Escherichia coli]
MTTRVYAYLRASTKEQDANRAKSELQSFADSLSISIA